MIPPVGAADLARSLVERFDAVATAWPAKTAIRTPAAGIDLMGQRLIFGFGQVLVVLLALIPAVIAAGLLGFIVQAFAGPAVAVAVATVAVILVLIGELWCGVWLVGRRFETLDLVEARP
jgi:hypothetical protein